MEEVLYLQAECNVMPASDFHQMPLEVGLPSERNELPEVDCVDDVETLKKLKLGLRSTLWSRPSSTTSHLQQKHQPQHQENRPTSQPQLQQMPQHQQQKSLLSIHKQQLAAASQQLIQQQQPHRQQHSPATSQKHLSEKSDYSISV
uniref:Uncharacterized protein n=1 Tax=Glossina austeni TaxID=7395 RepID=A0A1A9URQ1_GLOAU